MKNDSLKEIWNQIKKSKNVLMSLHPKPDGDSLACCVSMKYVLEKQGKQVTLVSKDELSESLAELEISKEVDFGKDLSEISWKGFDLIILLDHGTLQYYSLPKNINEKVKGKPVINVDHHETNSYYGTLNYVDVNAPSTCSILIELFKSQKIDIDKELAKRLFIGIATDTGFFRHINSNKAFKDAAFLSEAGADYFNDILNKILGKDSIKIKKMQGVLLNNLEIIEVNGLRCAFGFMKKEEIKKQGLGIADLRLGIEIIRGIKGVDFELTLYELEGELKGSLRSSTIDVSLFAKNFGGGGHKLSAGFVIKNVGLKEARKHVFEAIEKTVVKRI